MAEIRQRREPRSSRPCRGRAPSRLVALRWVIAPSWVLALGCDGPAPPPADAFLLPPAVVLTAEPDPSEAIGCASPIASGEVRAKHVACDAELLHGPLAMGRPGDVLLENAHVRFVIRTGDEAATTIGGFAGGVVDAERTGGIDRLKELFPLFDLATARSTAVVVTESGAGGTARVRVLFEAAPLGLLETVAPGAGRAAALRGAIDYVLGPDDRALRIELQVTTLEGTAAAAFIPGAAALIGGGMDLLQPGVGLLGDGVVGGAGLPAVLAEGDDEALAIGVMTDGVTVGDDGSVLSAVTIQLLSTTDRVVVRQGAVARFAIAVAPAATGADAWNAALRTDPAPTLALSGEPGERAEIRDAGGAILLRTRLDASGAAAVHLAPGTYEAGSGFARWLGGALDASLTADRSLGLPHAPRGELSVSSTVEGESAPVRATVLDPAGEEVLRFVAIGDGSVALPPGSYHVAISHGLELDVHEEDVVVTDGGTVAIVAALDRAIDTTGLVSTDFHLHSELSTDSVHRVDLALRMIAAEGVDLVASTDHDFLTDYAAIAEGAGVAPWLVTVVGEEVSSTIYGHLGGYPLARDVDRAGAGAVVWLEASALEAIAGIRSRGDEALGGALVQINHPRLRGTGFFDYLGLAGGVATADPLELGLPAGTDLDAFDADVVEVWNGYTRGDNEASFADWLALRARGRRLTMVGNSDSHRPDLPAGSPRTFVRVPDDSPGAFGWEEVGSALRAGEATVAGGILVTAELAGPRSGDVVPVHVRVQAPPWADATRLRIYAGEDVAVDRPIDPSVAAVRLETTIDVPLGGASFVVVRADGSRAPEPFLHFAPFGVTNAIEVP